MASPDAGASCKSGSPPSNEVGPPLQQSEDAFTDGSRTSESPSPLQLLLQSLQTEYYEIKKADIMMQKHWSKWMESVERWLQNQAHTQEQLETILKASVAEYNDKVSNENDRVCYPDVLQKSSNGDKPAAWRSNSVMARLRSLDRDSVPSPLKSVMVEPLQPCVEEDWKRNSGMLHEDSDLDDQTATDPSSRPTSPQKQETGEAYSARALRITDVSVQEVSRKDDEFRDFEDPFQRKKRNKPSSSSKTPTSKPRPSQAHAFRSWMLMHDDHEDVVLRTKAEQLSAVPDSEAYAATYASNPHSCFDSGRAVAARFLRQPGTELFIATIILTNSIVVGIEVDWTVNNPKETTLPIGFSILGYTFNFLFAIEVGLRMFALSFEFFTGSQWGWNIFDLALVMSSIVEVVIELIYRSGTENFSSLRIVRMVRITRILRVLRVARVVRLLVALRLLFVQIVGTLRSVFWAMILLVLILYTFAMIFAQVASEHIAAEERDMLGDLNFANIKKYWSTVPRSMFTLYKTVTGGVDWEYVSLALSDIHWFWVGTFLCFLSFTVFAVLNVVVGVFCQSAIQSASMDHENAVRLKLHEKLNFTRKMQTLFRDIDESKDGKLTYHELEAHLDDEQVSAYIASLGIDPSDSWDLFKLLDRDSNQNIEIDEFIEGCMRLRGPARALDSAKILYENRIMRKQLISFMRHTQSYLNFLVAGQGSTPTFQLGKSLMGNIDEGSIERYASDPGLASAEVAAHAPVPVHAAITPRRLHSNF